MAYLNDENYGAESENLPSIPESSTNKQVRKKRLTSDVDIILIAKTSLVQLKASDFKCKNVSPELLEAAINKFENSFDTKSNKVTNNKVLRSDLSTINKKIDSGVSGVKAYAVHILGQTEAIKYYPKIGIEFINGKFYGFPKKTSEKITALKKFIPLYSASNVINDKYPVAYFTDLLNEYEDINNQLINQTGSISTDVNKKDIYRAEILEYFNNIICLIKCNVPKESIDAVLRLWGFQKERY